MYGDGTSFILNSIWRTVHSNIPNENKSHFLITLSQFRIRLVFGDSICGRRYEKNKIVLNTEVTYYTLTYPLKDLILV